MPDADLGGLGEPDQLASTTPRDRMDSPRDSSPLLVMPGTTPTGVERRVRVQLRKCQSRSIGAIYARHGHRTSGSPSLLKC
jgi:hypothetical protein